MWSLSKILRKALEKTDSLQTFKTCIQSMLHFCISYIISALNCVHSLKNGKLTLLKSLKRPDDYRQTSSYRPISLLSIFAKISEKLLINRITHFTRSNNKFNAIKYGFVPQKSTEDAMHSLKNILNAFERKGFLLTIAADIRGTFDHFWWAKILLQLRLKRCPMNLYLLTKSYFSHRIAKLWYLNEEVVRDLAIGCPQGSALGPWLWNESFDIFDIALQSKIWKLSQTIPDLIFLQRQYLD